MRVLYIACNPSDAEDLMIEREITDLQRVFLRAQGEPVEFISLPELPIEQLPMELTEKEPDILHISAHGGDGRLALADESGNSVEITASMLVAYLSYKRSPRLVYLNACNSDVLAEQLSATIPFVIGTTAPITNRAARASAQLFYNRLLSGNTLNDSFLASKATIDALQASKCSSRLYARAGFDIKSERLHESPAVVAEFAKGGEVPIGGRYRVTVGISGCPANTSQVVIYTDDETFIEKSSESEYKVAGQLCRVVRTYPTRGRVWSRHVEDVYGDYRIFASGVTGNGTMFSARGALCDALEERYALGAESAAKTKKHSTIVEAIKQLRANDEGDGSGA